MNSSDVLHRFGEVPFVVELELGTLSLSIGEIFQLQPGSVLRTDHPAGAPFPLFAGNVRLAEAEREHALVQYEKTIQTAFHEVSDSLIAHQRVRESRERQQELVYALEDRLRLAYLRYRGGVDTQLNALDADRDLFSAQLGLSQLQLSEVLTVVQLYKALGGGWQ